MVRANMIHNQKKPAMEKRPINLGLYLACIKNMMTKEALIKAMTKATGVFIKPMLTKAAATVSEVPIIRAKNIRK